MMTPTTTPQRPRSPATKTVLLSVSLLLAVSSVGTFGTWAVFSASVSNTNNQWSAGGVALAADDNTTMFVTTSGNGGLMKPGDTVDKCIKITYTGTVDSDVRLYGDIVDADADLAQYLDVTIDRDNTYTADPGSTHNCGAETFTAEANVMPTAKLNTVAADFANGYDLGTWTNNAYAVFRIRVQYPNTYSNNEGMNGEVEGSTFTWEARAGT